MTSERKALRIIPSIFFILLAAFWVAEYYMSLGIVNYSAILVIVLLLVQAIHNHKYIGLFYGGILTGFSVYKLVEAAIVYAETVNPTDGSFRFLIIKGILFGVSLLMALVFLWFYICAIKKQNTTTTSI